MKFLIMTVRDSIDGEEKSQMFTSINDANRKTGVHRATINNSLKKKDWVKDSLIKFEWLERKPTIGKQRLIIVQYLYNGIVWDTRQFGSLTLASKHTGVSRDRIRKSIKEKLAMLDTGYQENEFRFYTEGNGIEDELGDTEHIMAYLRHQAQNFNRNKIPLVELEEKGYIYTTYYAKLEGIHSLVGQGIIDCDGIVVTYK